MSEKPIWLSLLSALHDSKHNAVLVSCDRQIPSLQEHGSYTDPHVGKYTFPLHLSFSLFDHLFRPPFQLLAVSVFSYSTPIQNLIEK